MQLFIQVGGEQVAAAEMRDHQDQDRASRRLRGAGQDRTGREEGGHLLQVLTAR